MSKQNFLHDKIFLSQLDAFPHREVYARISALTWDELPIEYIEGKCTGGSLSIDGASSLRRTCSLSMVANDISLNEFYWGLNTKFRLEIGLKNPLIDERYVDDVLWFPQGIFILTSFNTSKSASSYTISLTGKDKMCMLNGDLGGSFDIPVVFDNEEDADGNITKVPIVTIIQNLLAVFGHEDLRNVLINNIDDYGYELLDYYGDQPLYMLKKYDENIYLNLTFNGDMEMVVCTRKTDNEPPSRTGQRVKLSEIDIDGTYDPGMNQYLGVMGTIVAFSDESMQQFYTVRKVQKGDTVGYRLSDLVYPSDLAANPGDSITSVLDKIVSMLGNYEYFYDEDGRFIFQEKKNNIHSDWSSVQEGHGGLYVDPMSTPIMYTFFDSPLITQITNNPQFAKIKNDYSIWGTHKLPSGVEQQVHLRCALERKPTRYTTITVTEAEAAELSEITDYDVPAQSSHTYVENKLCDWREIIYQMSKDYHTYGWLEDFKYRVLSSNPEDYPTGITGYEDFYVDFIQDWRLLYNPDFLKYTASQPDKNLVYYKKDALNNMVQYSWDEVFRLKTKREMFNLNEQFYDHLGNQTLFEDIPSPIDSARRYYKKDDKGNLIEYTDIYKKRNSDILYYRMGDTGQFLYKDSFWNVSAFNNPSSLPFWFELYGEGTPLERYMISSIGDRSKVVNDKDVTAIYYAETPDVLFTTAEQEALLAGKELPPQYTQIRLPESMNSLFTISAQGKSAQTTFESALYDHTYLNDTINITAIPIYHLNVNGRIEVYDKDAGINGEYIVSRITLPLTYNGTMQITAAKAETIIY